MAGLLPSPASTLAIILGASEFPKARDVLTPSPSFLKSAEEFRNYLLSREYFGLQPEHLLYLFDSPDPSSRVDENVRDFLKKNIEDTQPGSDSVRDLLVYYVGHGGFSGGGAEYYLALRDTRVENDLLTSYSVRSLAKTLKEYARNVRRYLILDSCFAASAYTEFMGSGPLQVAGQKALEELPPGKGTALLCASGPRNPARAPANATYTMFSGAMLEVLRSGVSPDEANFSFLTLAELAMQRIKAQYDDQSVRPEIHFPDQSQGSIGHIPFFPNPRVHKPSVESRLDRAERVLQVIQERQGPLLIELRNNTDALADFGKQIQSVNERVDLALTSLKSDGGVGEQSNASPPRRHGRFLVSESDWLSIPPDVKVQIRHMELRSINSYVWILLCSLVLLIEWTPLQALYLYPVPLIASTVSIFLAVITIFSLARRRSFESASRDPNEYSPPPWEHLDVVVAVRLFQAAELVPGFWVDRRFLAATALLMVPNGLASLFFLLVKQLWK